jgi:hypothetical protein
LPPAGGATGVFGVINVSGKYTFISLQTATTLPILTVKSL